MSTPRKSCPSTHSPPAHDRSRRPAAKRRGLRLTRRTTPCACDQCALVILPISPKSSPSLSRFSHALPQRARKEVSRLHAMRGIVRARVHAAGLGMFRAKIASRRFFSHHSLFFRVVLVVAFTL